MEAKDTVMNDDEIRWRTFTPKTKAVPKPYKNIAEAQAEISFKAGRKAAADEYEKFIQATVIPDSKKAGIRKVVEWINSRHPNDIVTRAFWEEDWQAKLKDWGIETK